MVFGVNTIEEAQIEPLFTLTSEMAAKHMHISNIIWRMSEKFTCASRAAEHHMFLVLCKKYKKKGVAGCV